MKYQNVSALKQLIDLYKGISLQKLQEFKQLNARAIMKQLTGLATTHCKLCSYLFDKYEVDNDYYSKGQIQLLCSKCVHAAKPGDGRRKSGYCFLTRGRQEILKSSTPEELYENIQVRIDYLENELLPTVQENK